MTIFMWTADFKIRKKEDARKFVRMSSDRDFGCFKGLRYWTDGETDYCFDAKARTVSERPVTERGNIFSPYFCDSTDEEHTVNEVWRLRKYINAQIFDTERY